jgi:hypothetical protein
MEVAVKLTDEELQQLRTPPSDNVRSAYLEKMRLRDVQINAVIDELLAARKVVAVADDDSPTSLRRCEALIAYYNTIEK